MPGESTTTATPKSDDGTIAIMILVATVICVVVGFVLHRRKQAAKKSYFRESLKSPSGGAQAQGSGFQEPIEKHTYEDTKATSDLSNPAHVEILKKLLMHRALKVIPMLLNLQNEGQSVDRLYKKGMLTDDMHYKMKEMKTFVDSEVAEVQAEAALLGKGWEQHIWPQAMTFHNVLALKFALFCFFN